MADFVEVMDIKSRMCKYYYGDCSAGCPLYSTNFCSMLDESLSEKDFKDAEAIILDWGKKHPVYYPTWIEWLKSMGIIPYLDGRMVERDNDDNYLNGHVNVNEIIFKPIPKDVADKFGIKPREN